MHTNAAGRVAINDMLGRAVCTIFSQLGKDNPAVKGTAFMQASRFYLCHVPQRLTLRLP